MARTRGKRGRNGLTRPADGGVCSPEDGAIGFRVVRDRSLLFLRADGGFLIDAGGRFVNSSGNVLLPELIVPDDTLEIAIDPAQSA